MNAGDADQYCRSVLLPRCYRQSPMAAVVPADRNGTVKRILIADDHEVVRSGLRAIIETRADWTVGGEAIDGRDAVALALEMEAEGTNLRLFMPGQDWV